MIPRNGRKHYLRWRWCALGLGITILLLGFLLSCRSLQNLSEPVISFSVVPVVNPGSPDSLEPIQGRVLRAKPNYRLILYSFGGDVWWVQPFTSHPFTEIKSDSTWQNTIHLGEQYAALVVEDSYSFAKKLQKLPAKGAGVLAIATVPGSPYHPKTIQFSGYEWEVRQISDGRGGKLNPYAPANAWVDQSGYLHLAVVRRNDQWICADVGLRQSLGPGSYSFTVRDVSQLDPAATMTMYTWELGSTFNREIDVEISRWGNPEAKNAQFVIQPYYEPLNVSRFEAPPGIMNFSFRWEVGTVSFQAARGRTGEKTLPLAEHTFASGVPNPGGGSIHINLYAFGKARTPMKTPAEVVVERFTYAP